MPLPLILLLSSLLLTLLATTSFLLALRRRPLGQSPHCSACRYNLSFRPEDSTRCPECGANITVPKSITTGLPQRNRHTLTLTSSLLALSLLTFATLATFILPQLDLTPYKPLRWLEYDLASPTPTQRAAALNEFYRRLAPFTPLSPPTTSRDPTPYLALADRLLARQKDLSSPWSPEMGDLLESLYALNILDEPHWSDFVTHATTYTINIRPTLVRGNPLPLTIKSLLRSASNPNFGLRTEYSLNLSQGPISSPTFLSSNRNWDIQVIDSSLISKHPFPVTCQKPNLTSFTDGPLTATFTLTTLYYDRKTARDLSTTQTFSLPITLLPRTASDIRPTFSPTLRSDLQSALVTPSVSLDLQSEYLSIFFRTTPLPEAIAYDILFLIDNTEYPITTLTAPANTSGLLSAHTSPLKLPPLPNPLPPTLTLLLRPNPTASLQSPSRTFANVPLRFDNVPVKVLFNPTPTTNLTPLTPTTQPTTSASQPTTHPQP